MTLSLCFIVRKLDKWKFVYDGLRRYCVAKNAPPSLLLFHSFFRDFPLSLRLSFLNEYSLECYCVSVSLLLSRLNRRLNWANSQPVSSIGSLTMNSESFPGTQHHRQEGEGETEKGGGRQTQTLGGPGAHFLGEPRRGGSQGWCLHGEARAAAQKRGALCVCVCVQTGECLPLCPSPSHLARSQTQAAADSSLLFYLMCFGFVFTVHNLLCRPSQPLFPPVCHLFTVAHLDYWKQWHDCRPSVTAIL